MRLNGEVLHTVTEPYVNIIFEVSDGRLSNFEFEYSHITISPYPQRFVSFHLTVLNIQ